MKDLDPIVLLAVMQEMLGPVLWLLAAVAVLGTAGFAGLLLHERRIVARRLLYAQAAGLAGGIAALALMAGVSSSGFTDAAGPADWLLIALVFALGLAGTTVLAYTVAGWWEAAADPGSPRLAAPPPSFSLPSRRSRAAPTTR